MGRLELQRTDGECIPVYDWVCSYAVCTEDDEGDGEEEAEQDADGLSKKEVQRAVGVSEVRWNTYVQLVKLGQANDGRMVDRFALQSLEERFEIPSAHLWSASDMMREGGASQDRSKPQRQTQAPQAPCEKSVRLALQRVLPREYRDQRHVHDGDDRAHNPGPEIDRLEPVLVWRGLGRDEEEPETQLLEVRDHLQRPRDGEREIQREDRAAMRGGP